MTENQANNKMAETEAVMRRRALIMDSLNLVPVYTGQDITWTLDQFKTKFQSLAEFLIWAEEDQLFAITQRLAGVALETYINFKSSIKTIQDLFEIFEEKFEKKRDQGDILNDFWSFKQQPGVSVAEFLAKSIIKANAVIKAHSLPQACRETTKEQWLIAMLQKNLLPYIKKGVIARNPKTIKDLERIALLEEKAYKAVAIPSQYDGNSEDLHFAGALNVNRNQSATSDSNPFCVMAKEITDKLQDLSLKISKLEREQFEKNKREKIICFFCRDAGHVQKWCPKKQNGGSNVRFRDVSKERWGAPRSHNNHSRSNVNTGNRRRNEPSLRRSQADSENFYRAGNTRGQNFNRTDTFNRNLNE